MPFQQATALARLPGNYFRAYCAIYAADRLGGENKMPRPELTAGRQHIHDSRHDATARSIGQPCRSCYGADAQPYRVRPYGTRDDFSARQHISLTHASISCWRKMAAINMRRHFGGHFHMRAPPRLADIFGCRRRRHADSTHWAIDRFIRPRPIRDDYASPPCLPGRRRHVAFDAKFRRETIIFLTHTVPLYASWPSRLCISRSPPR